MKRLLIKTLILVMTIFIMFFIKNMDVLADDGEFYSCDFISPLTYIDQYNHATDIQLTLKYNVPYEKGYLNNVLPGLKYGWTFNVSTNSINSFCLIKDYNSYNIGFKLNDPIIEDQNGGNFTTVVINQKNLLTYEYLEIKDDNSSYIMVYVKNGELKAKNATQEDYENYLKNTQYKDITSKDRLYNFINIKDMESDRHFSSDKCVYSCNMTGIGEIEDKKKSIVNYIKKTGGIVFVNPKIKEKYPNKRWKEYIDILKKEKNLSEEKFKEKMGVLNIDTNDENTRTFNKVYYDSTKEKWNKFMQDETNDNTSTGTSLTRKQYFAHWFENVSRYMFEDNLSNFKKYFDYLYADKISEDGDYKIMSTVLEGLMEDHKVENTEKNCLESYPCSPYCNGTISEESEYVCSGPAFDACIKESVDYKNCETAYKKCTEQSEKSCQSVPSNALKGCVSLKMDECLKEGLGYDKYIEFKNKQSEAQATLEKRRQNALDKIVDNLYKISSPSLNIDFKGYKASCDDVKIFHDFYVLLKIFAPILVIVFGSLDYAKAVIASDVEKMEKSKKKFPMRVMLLLIFVFVPIIISITLKLYAQSTKKDVNTSLMYCVINGSES